MTCPNCNATTTRHVTVPGYHSDVLRCAECNWFVGWADKIAVVEVTKSKRGKKDAPSN